MGTVEGEQTWFAVNFRTRQGDEPVAVFVDNLPPAAQEIIGRQIRRLKRFGPMLPSPYTHQVRGKLRELRCSCGNLSIRLLYHEAESHLIVLLHIFVKKTPRIPLADIALAESRWTDFKARMDAEPRVPPRPIGSDA